MYLYVEQFFACLCCSEDALLELVELRPYWDGEFLWINAACEFEENLLTRIHDLFMYLFKLDDFTDSRWGGQQDDCGLYLALDALGLTKIVELTLAKKEKVAQWNLGGAERVNGDVRSLLPT